MLVLRLMLMVLTIICLMDGHAEVSSSTTGIRNRRESPVVKPNETEVQILDRKKKKKPKKPKKSSKKKKPKPKKPKPVTTTPTMTTSTLKTTTILTTHTVETTATTTDFPTTTATTFKTTTSTATTTEASSSTASTTTATTTIPTTTITTTATTSSLITTAATTADSGAEGECKATNGKPCIFPFKDGKEEYNECKNHGGTYFWCATSVYDSGKYKHWSYCPKDGPCPLEGDGEECRAINNKPCVFPFKDGEKEYIECADHGGQYFWCATGTNSAGKYTAWSKCPKDGSCPLPQKSTTPVMTSTATAASTTPLTTGTSTTPDQIENKVVSSLKDLVKEESKDGTLEMLVAMNKMTQTIIEDLKGQKEDSDPKIGSNHTFEGENPPSQKISHGYKKGLKSGEIREVHQNYEYDQDTVDWRGSIYPISDASFCCSKCQSISSNAVYFDYDYFFQKCYCYKKLSNREPMKRRNNLYSAGECGSSMSCPMSNNRNKQMVRGIEPLVHTPVACPDIHTRYLGDVLGSLVNVPDWQSCATICPNIHGCLYWTWHPHDPAKPNDHNCFFKEELFLQRQLVGIQSGFRRIQANFAPSPPVNNVEYIGENIGQSTETTWQACAVKCINNPDCLYWVWVTNNYNDANLHNECFLRKKKFSKETEVDVVSGMRSCKGAIWTQGSPINCLAGCGGKGGLCPQICAPIGSPTNDGFCCRNGINDCPIDAQMISPIGQYSCVERSDTSDVTANIYSKIFVLLRSYTYICKTIRRSCKDSTQTAYMVPIHPSVSCNDAAYLEHIRNNYAPTRANGFCNIYFECYVTSQGTKPHTEKILMDKWRAIANTDPDHILRYSKAFLYTHNSPCCDKGAECLRELFKFMLENVSLHLHVGFHMWWAKQGSASIARNCFLTNLQTFKNQHPEFAQTYKLSFTKLQFQPGDENILNDQIV